MWQWIPLQQMSIGNYRALQRFDEAFMLHALVLSRKPLNILEIGVRYGGSTRIMAEALRTLDEQGILTGGKIDAVDGSDRFDFEPPNDLRSYINVIRKNSPEGVPNKIYDLIHIDGSHKEKNVLVDLSVCCKRVHPGSLIIMHDVNLPGVRRAIEIFEGQHPEFRVFYDWTYRKNDPERPGGQQALLLLKEKRICST